MATTKRINTKTKTWAGIILAQFILFLVLSKIPSAVLLFENLFEHQKSIHQQFFCLFPFSFGDVLYMILGILFLYTLYVFFTKKRSRGKIMGQLLMVINIVYFFYQMFWGMLYFQEPIIHKLSSDEPTIAELKHLAEVYLEKCKTSRARVTEDGNGIFFIENFEMLHKQIIADQKRIPRRIHHKSNTSVDIIRKSIFSGVMSYTGIYGYYNPFTSEAQYNASLPHTIIPFTLAHESAHQLGYAREQEASFLGYLIGSHSENADIRYSTELYALKSILYALQEKEPLFVKDILEKYSNPMKRDKNFEMTFAKNHQGWIDDFFAMTNNLFLKVNQQEGSITYSYFIDLLVRYERDN